jgi:hypothetical protein
MTAVSTPQAPPGNVGLTLPRADLAPGARRLDVTATEGGLALGHDSIGLSVVPVVTGPAVPLATAVPVDVDTAHAAPDVEVFLAGQPLDAAAVTFISATKLQLTLPSTTPAGPAEIVLRAGKVAGPAAVVEVAP